MRCGFIKTLFILLATTAVHISYGQISDKEVTRAIKSTDMEVVIQFLDEGNDIDGIYGKEKTTLLNYSIKIDSYCVFERLLELGANPSVISNGKTPIMYAV
jgi:hypothetical protein